jgi:hypothetical protein
VDVEMLIGFVKSGLVSVEGFGSIISAVWIAQREPNVFAKLSMLVLLLSRMIEAHLITCAINNGFIACM